MVIYAGESILHETAGLIEWWGRVGHGGGDNAFGARVCGRGKTVVKKQCSE